MYQLELTKKEYQQFKREAKSKMLMQGMTIQELSKKTGYSTQSIYNFFANTNSRFMAFAIAECLELKGYGHEV